MDIFAKLPFELQTKVLMMRPRHPVAELIESENEDVLWMKKEVFHELAHECGIEMLHEVLDFAPEIREASHVLFSERFYSSKQYAKEVIKAMQFLISIVSNELFVESINNWHMENNGLNEDDEDEYQLLDGEAFTYGCQEVIGKLNEML